LVDGGRRPALVISHDLFNHHTGLSIVCPITRRAKRIGKAPDQVLQEALLPLDACLFSIAQVASLAYYLVGSEMNANDTVTVVLAAPGARSAWGTERFAVPVCGVPVLERVRQTLVAAGLRTLCLVHNGAPGVAGGSAWTLSVRADEPLAALTALSAGRSVFVLCGDLPLLTAETVRSFLDAFGSGRASRLIESSGAMAAFRTSEDVERLLAGAVRSLDGRPFEPCGEGTWLAGDAADVRRLDSPAHYSAICEVARLRKLASLAAAGVLIVDTARTYVDDAATVGPGTTLLPGIHLRGDSAVGAGCLIGPDSWIESSIVEDGAVVRYSVLEGARVREHSTIGPFAHLRQGGDVGPEARIGNFVEVKASRLGRGVKASHLSYIGDADVGDGTNVGAGAITCNFDGTAKHRIVVEADVFVGSNVSLVAPVTIGHGAFIAAGSTITEDVPPHALAIARARQVIKEREGKPAREET
jgi:bifunctional N-acetylglucosamine-1-phosphate-uridyltransferase/glucosamine-1-phosphate-acetyltransferase GlmU-like protein